MRTIFPYFIALALCIPVAYKLEILGQPERPALNNVYDSTSAVLKYLGANDSRIGFANATEADSAWIDYSMSIPIAYGVQDSLEIADTLDMMSYFMNMRQVMYPYYTSVGGQKKLCGSVTFDSTNGVHPFIFEDSTFILPAIKWRDSLHHQGKQARFSVVRMPFIHDRIIILHAQEGDQVLMTKSLHYTIADHLPNKLNSTATTNSIDLSTFFHTIKKIDVR